MQQKFSIAFCTFSYGGNGGISSEVPDIREWMVPLLADLSRDERIGELRVFNLSDTPITMTRNRAVLLAREYKSDVLVMIDSDMKPDMYSGQEEAKPFFPSSFDFFVEHYHKGPVVIGAPYCGPPPVECVYVFRWQNRETGHASPDFQLEMYDRNTAVKMSGIQECAALPTGLIFFDMRAFELTEPKVKEDMPWFYYEFNDIYQSGKASTEDVTATRDISLAGQEKLGYAPVFCNWDAWAGHWKPKCVGKPVTIQAKDVSKKLRDCWEGGYEDDVRLVDFNSHRAAPAGSHPLLRYANLSDGSVRKMEWLNELMDRAPYGTFLEVGNREGGSLLLAVEHPKSSKVIGIDPYGGTPYTVPNGLVTTEYDDEMYERMKALIAASPRADKFTHHKVTSEDYMAQYPEWFQRFAFVYLDGSHEPDVVKKEIDYFTPRLYPGGIIVVDDVDTLPPDMLDGWDRRGDNTTEFRMAWKVC